MKITAKKLADICGVSRGTVDRALNKRPGINKETRELIIKTAVKMGYKPNYIAQSLVKGKTMSLGVVVFDLYNRFFAQLTNAIEIKAREKGYLVYITLTGKNALVEKNCIKHLVQRQVDGIILCSAVKDNEYVEYLNELKMPVVTVTNRIGGKFPFIGIDDRTAMKDAIMHIINKGYRRIIYVSPPLSCQGRSNIYAQHERYNGFREVIAKKHENIICNIVIENNYIEVIDNMVKDTNLKTAILCASDVYALEVLNHLKSKGIKIPQDIGVMGFDNIDILKYIEPALTTVSYSVEEIGKKAVEYLLKALNKEQCPRADMLKHRILQGNSL